MNDVGDYRKSVYTFNKMKVIEKEVILMLSILSETLLFYLKYLMHFEHDLTCYQMHKVMNKVLSIGILSLIIVNTYRFFMCSSFIQLYSTVLIILTFLPKRWSKIVLIKKLQSN